MNKMIKLGVIGTLLALGATQAKAATTNYWVQNVNLALKGYAQTGNQLLHGSLPTKQFIAFLSGVTNTALVESQTTVPFTNSFWTNLTVLTNFWLLPTGDLPRSYTITTNYPVTPDGGLTYYTNNIDFTNDIVVTRTSDTNVTYTFNNFVTVQTVPTNRTAYLFPGLPASDVTAVWTNQGPDATFALSGWVNTNAVSTRTSYTYAENPDFKNLPGAKLLYVTPIIDDTTLASKYVIRYRDGGKNVDTDVSSFIGENQGSPLHAVSEYIPIIAQTRMYAFSGVYFDNQAGTSFTFYGFDTQTWGSIKSKGNTNGIAVLKQRKMNVANSTGYITGQVQDRTFNSSPTMVNGTISISGGKLE
jgi:hypothetical protein